MCSVKKRKTNKSTVFLFISIITTLSITSANAANFTYNLTYDAVNRITQVTTGGSNQTNYTWQANGQLLTRTITGTRVLGDMDSSGTVDLQDVILSIQISAGIQASAINAAADVNKDGKMGIPETLYILRKVSE